MTTYQESGVDIEAGDRCSKIAYDAAKETFSGRKGMIGEPVTDEGGFTGMLDMGDFYLVQNDDGVGTKIEVAEMTGRFETLGYDLIAMVADDAVCVGAETVSVTNTLDAPKLDEAMIGGLMRGLKAAALEQKIVVPGGELAELGNALNGAVWNATAVGVVEKDKVITGADIRPEDVIIGLQSAGIRSNGSSLARKILRDAFGERWADEPFEGEKTWGEEFLTPSRIFHRAVLSLIGGFREPRRFDIKGIVHNTGGGIRGNLPRLLKKGGFGARLDTLPEPQLFFRRLMELGKVEREEAYKTWNMGIGMMMVVAPDEAEAVIKALDEQSVPAVKLGVVTGDGVIEF